MQMRQSSLRIAILVLAGSCVAPATIPAQSFTPSSPEVRQAIDRGVAYLSGASDYRLGAKALVGRVMLATKRREHPKVQEAVAAIREQLKSAVPPDMYSLGLCILFLVELDKEQYRSEIEQLLAQLRQRQKPHGGWGYDERPTGDTSMTQYAVLSAWAAAEAGFDSPREMWLKAVGWLLRTQDPSGGFGYQGTDSGGETLVPQHDVSVTLTYAALGSLYLCGDRLGLLRLAASDQSQLPDVFRRVELPKDKPKGAPKDAAPDDEAGPVDAVRYEAAINRALGWYAINRRALANNYVFYFFYTLERMETIREAAAGRFEKQPAWYVDAATYVVRHQLNDGSWNSTEGPVPATAFAILTLIRSTREVIEKTRGYGAGTLVSGRGLPGGEGAVEVQMGKVVPRPLTGPAEELLNKLDNVESPEYERAVEALNELARAADVERLSPVARRLRALAAGGPPAAKAAALRALARARNFDDAPLLIEALADADDGVFRAADEGLRFLTRRTGLAPLPAQLSANDRAVVAKRWKDWHQTIQPLPAAR